MGWIQGAVKRPGDFTAKAKARGMSVQEFSAHVRANPDRYDERTRRQAALAKTLRQIARHRKKKK